jgi:hypothetical protein
LIVSGSLRLEEGSLQASDRGLVVLANAISLEAGGTYHGLVMGLEELRIVPTLTGNAGLSIDGGVFAKGSNVETIHQQQHTACNAPVQKVDLVDTPLRITSTNITYDSRYTKVLNSLGSLTLKAWRMVP